MCYDIQLVHVTRFACINSLWLALIMSHCQFHVVCLIQCYFTFINYKTFVTIEIFIYFNLVQEKNSIQIHIYNSQHYNKKNLLEKNCSLNCAAKSPFKDNKNYCLFSQTMVFIF